MRLTCPSCAAEYEIAAEMIPPDGRDVQCSNCATTWFVEGAGGLEADGMEADGTARPAAPGGDDGLDAPGGRAPPPRAARNAREGIGGADEDVDPGPDRRLRPDPRTLEILRQEREFDARLAAEEMRFAIAGWREGDDEASVIADAGGAGARSKGVEDAPVDLEAEAAQERERMAAAAAIARARDAERAVAEAERAAATEAAAPSDVPGTARPGRSFDDAHADAAGPPPPDDRPASATGPAAVEEVRRAVEAERVEADREAAAARRARRERLPDIEAVGPTLDPSKATMFDPPVHDFPPERPRGGFRVGFSLAILALTAAAALYLLSPRIVEVVPAAAEPLATYRAWVDAARTDLGLAVERLTDRIERGA